MKRKILIYSLIGIIFLFFWLIYISQGQESHILKDKAWQKLSSRQKEVGEILAKGITQELLRRVREEKNKPGVKFKEAYLAIKITGNSQKEDLIVELVLLITEPNGAQWHYTVEKSWPKCPPPNSPEIKEAIQQMVEMAIPQIKIGPSIFA